MLFVEAKSLPQDFKVRRDIDAEDVLTNHIEFANEPKEGYVPLDFALSVRSIYDNTVLGFKNADGYTTYYQRMTNIGPYLPHRGLDLWMYVSSLAFLECVNYTNEVDNIMLRHSQFQPVGVLYPPCTTDNPVFYAHLYLSDPGMKLLQPHLKPEIVVTPIQTMTYQGNPSALLETLIIVKEENHE